MTEEEVYTKPERTITRPKKFNKKLIIIPIVIILVLIAALFLLPNFRFSPYATFSNGMVIEYPSNWYVYSDEYTKTHSWPFTVMSDSGYDPYKGVGAGIDNVTASLNQKGIFDVTAAIKDTEKIRTEDEIVNKTVRIVNESTGVFELKWFMPVRNVTMHEFYKIIKCDENLFELSIFAIEPFNSEHAAEIGHLVSSFRCA